MRIKVCSKPRLGALKNYAITPSGLVNRRGNNVFLVSEVPTFHFLGPNKFALVVSGPQEDSCHIKLQVAPFVGHIVKGSSVFP